MSPQILLGAGALEFSQGGAMDEKPGFSAGPLAVVYVCAALTIITVIWWVLA